LLTVPRPRAGDLAGAPGEASSPVRERVLAARRSLREQPPTRTQPADELLTRAVERLPLSGRGRARVARVAETIAALAGAEAVAPEHLAEALSYRPPVELTE
jgi:magnesium chelatase family protein